VFVTKLHDFAAEHPGRDVDKGDCSVKEDDAGENSRLYLTSWIEWIVRKMNTEMRRAWEEDYDDMRKLFVLNRLGLLSSKRYTQNMEKSVEPYFPELQFCYRHEYLEAMEAHLEEDHKTSKMISFYYLCESKEGAKEAVVRLCRKFKIVDELVDVVVPGDDVEIPQDVSWKENEHPEEAHGHQNVDDEVTKVRRRMIIYPY
jgi:hypothetical protein